MFKLQTPLLILFVLLTIFISLFVQVLIGFKTTILNPNYYTNLIEKHHLYELPQNYVLLTIKENSNLLLTEPICNVLTPSINRAFSDEWAKYQSEKAINNTINYVKGTEDELKLEIMLKDRKELLESDLINRLETKYKTDELAVFQIDSVEVAANNIVESTNLPDSLNIITALNFSEKEFQHRVDKLKEYYSLAKYAPYLLLFLFTVLLIFIGKNGLGLKWLGYSLVISACFTIIAAFAGSIWLDDYLAANISKQSSLLTTIGTDPLIIVSILKNSLINSIKKISIIFGVVGAILFLWGKIWSDKYYKKSIENPL